MRIERRDTQKTDNSAGVSEIIGAVLLISLVVVSIGIVAAMLFGQQTPTKIPNMNFMTGVSADQKTLYLSHTGGDTLNLDEFSVVLDGVPVSPTVSGGGTQWSLGTTLIVPISTVPQNVQIVYNSSGSAGAVLLRQASNINTTVNVTADQIPYLDCSAVRNWDCADQIPSEIIIARYMVNTSTKKIDFMRAWQTVGTIVGGASNHFNFTVSKPNSTIHLATPSNPNCDGGTFYSLPTGTKVGITFISSPDYFYVYGLAPQIWELSAGANYRMSTTLIFPNGTTVLFYGNPICHAYITEYSNLDSTLDITTTTNGKVTSLIVNETHEIEGLDSTTIKLVHFSPIGNGMFLITYGGYNTPIFVVGWADAVQYNGVNQTGLGF